MEKLNNLHKKLNTLNINKMKICGYLSDYEIDKAVESEEFNFISNTLIDYFETKDIGYILNKFKESGLSNKIDDVDFDINEWTKTLEEIKIEKERIVSEMPDSELGKDDYISEMVKKRTK